MKRAVCAALLALAGCQQPAGGNTYSLDHSILNMMTTVGASTLTPTTTITPGGGGLGGLGVRSLGADDTGAVAPPYSLCGRCTITDTEGLPKVQVTQPVLPQLKPTTPAIRGRIRGQRIAPETPLPRDQNGSAWRSPPWMQEWLRRTSTFIPALDAQRI